MNYKAMTESMKAISQELVDECNRAIDKNEIFTPDWEWDIKNMEKRIAQLDALQKLMKRNFDLHMELHLLDCDYIELLEEAQNQGAKL